MMVSTNLISRFVTTAGLLLGGLQQPALSNDDMVEIDSSGAVDSFEGKPDAALQIADCNMVSTAEKLEKLRASLTDASTNLEIILAQAGGFKNSPGNTGPDPSLSTLQELIKIEKNPNNSPKLKSVLAAAEGIIETAAVTDELLSISSQVRGDPILPQFQAVAVSKREELTRQLTSLTKAWRKRIEIRTSTKAHWTTDFSESCSGKGFWRMVTAHQVAGGEDTDMSASTYPKCQAFGYQDAGDFLRKVKEEFDSEATNESDCRDYRQIEATDTRIVYDSICPWGSEKAHMTLTYDAVAEDRVKMQSVYHLDSSDVKMNAIFERCP